MGAKREDKLPTKSNLTAKCGAIILILSRGVVLNPNVEGLESFEAFCFASLTPLPGRPS